ncbi:TDT family transporter [Nocardia sp. 348MFTsu5.1]|uniref:TDT family transporter n=1 Tax=Nocardia sp. 348MFTsu5.1 TaxID=1172185 RepID=UPI00037616C0|nr:TDT family transporter [Nocardia sp. 348MFTsu5.1]
MTPNWYSAIMGTGIVATSGVALHSSLPGVNVLTTAFWLLAAIGLVIATILFLQGGPTRHAADPAMAHFYGAPAMALLTVGAGTIQLAPQFIDAGAAVWIGGGLWLAGTAAGVFTALWIPFRMITGAQSAQSGAMPSWLMPVVPPMVSAATGSLLIQHVSEGQLRLGLLTLCYGLFGLSLLVGMLTMGMVYSRLIHRGLPSAQVAPTVWIMLGMLGQSITAAVLLGNRASLVFVGEQESIAAGLQLLGIGYGLVMGGFAAFVFALAVSITVHNVRRGMSFTPAWWSFTFPVGTCVTGAAALGFATDSVLLHVISVGLYALLLGAWCTVAYRSVRLVLGERVTETTLRSISTARNAVQRTSSVEVSAAGSSVR